MGDADFSTRWRLVKARFSRWIRSALSTTDLPSRSRIRHSEVKVWQRRFREHAIRDRDDLNRHIDYVHYNPLKHGLVREPGQWPYSTFHRYRECPEHRTRPFANDVITKMECE